MNAVTLSPQCSMNMFLVLVTMAEVTLPLSRHCLSVHFIREAMIICSVVKDLGLESCCLCCSIFGVGCVWKGTCWRFEVFATGCKSSLLFCSSRVVYLYI